MFAIIIHQLFLLTHDWSEGIICLNMPQLTLENIWVIFPRLSPSTNYVLHNLTNLAHAKMFESWIISLDIRPWTLPFHWSSQFSLSLALENCLFFGTDNVGRQLSRHLCFAPNGIYCFMYIVLCADPNFPDIVCLPLLQPILPYCTVSHTMSSFFAFSQDLEFFMLENYQGVLKWFCHQSNFWLILNKLPVSSI